MKILFGEKEMSFDAPISVFDAAKEAELVSRAHIAALVNGKLCAMNYVIDADADVKLLTFEDKDGRRYYRFVIPTKKPLSRVETEIFDEYKDKYLQHSITVHN